MSSSAAFPCTGCGEIYLTVQQRLHRDGDRYRLVCDGCYSKLYPNRSEPPKTDGKWRS